MCQKIYFEINVLQIRFTLGLLWWLRWYRICLPCRRSGFEPWVGKLAWRKAWQPTPVFLPGESPWTEEPGGLQSMRLQRVRDDWAIKHSTTLWLGFGLSNRFRVNDQNRVSNQTLEPWTKPKGTLSLSGASSPCSGMLKYFLKLQHSILFKAYESVATSICSFLPVFLPTHFLFIIQVSVKYLLFREVLSDCLE